MSEVINITGLLDSAQREDWLNGATSTIMDSLTGLRDVVRATIEEELEGQNLKALQSGDIDVIPILDIHIDTGDRSLRRGLKPPLPFEGDGGSAG